MINKQLIFAGYQENAFYKRPHHEQIAYRGITFSDDKKL